MHQALDIEAIHTKFLRRILGVKQSTNLSALYGETGRVPLSVFRQVIMIKYYISKRFIITKTSVSDVER